MDLRTNCNWKPRKVSAKRDFPDAFYSVTNESKNRSPVLDHGVPKLFKKHKVCEFAEGNYKDHVGPDEGFADERRFDSSNKNDDFISLETGSVSSESCSSETRGSDYDIIPRMIYTKSQDMEELDKDFTEKKIESLNYKTYSDDEDDDAESEEEEEAKLGTNIELRLHGVCLKKIRCYQTQKGLKLKLVVDNLQKIDNIIDVKSFGKESKTRESVINRVTKERVKTYEQFRSFRKRSVSAVRCYPPGCGPNAAILSDKDLKKAIDGSRKHMLTCKSCGI